MIHSNPVTLILIATVILSGCQTTQTKQTPQYRPKTILANGLFVHKLSNFKFPEYIRRFRRLSITYFNEEQTNFGVAYQLPHPTHPVAASVYVYPILDIPAGKNNMYTRKQQYETDFQRIKNEILQIRPGTVLTDEKEVFYGNGVGKSATYEYTGIFAGQPKLQISELFLFTRGQWYLKFRITTPKSSYARAKHEIRKIIRAIKQDTEN